MSDRRLTPGERHDPEPEIIPPGTEGGGPVWGFEEHGFQRIYVTRIGPFGLLPIVFLGGAVMLALFALLFGFLLILLPVAGLAAAIALMGSLFRRRPRVPR
ncbi:MAG: hypothetical protein J2P49_07550 [Methylocapsa sp.]|nr:hypothetical protein [Methylocapsa sp.]